MSNTRNASCIHRDEFWDRFGPAYVFFAFIGLDLLVRMPLLVSMPETLRLRPGSPTSAEG